MKLARHKCMDCEKEKLGYWHTGQMGKHIVRYFICLDCERVIY